MRTDQIPRAALRLLRFLSIPFALPLWLLFRVCGAWSRVRIVGRFPDHGCIWGLWHEQMYPLLSSFRRLTGRHVWMIHPSLSMVPATVLFRWVGVDLFVLGSTGHGGRAAADQLAEHLKSGCSTLLAVDGPSGPPRVMKSGILHLAAQSGVPIVPIRISTSRQWVIPWTWDGKRVPLPFGTITVHLGAPIFVDRNNPEESREEVRVALG